MSWGKLDLTQTTVGFRKFNSAAPVLSRVLVDNIGTVDREAGRSIFPKYTWQQPVFTQ